MKLGKEAQDIWDRTFQALRNLRTRHVHFEVRPRYCAGSPALVDAEIACQEAVDEPHFRDMCLTGVFGADKKARAEKLGLKGIVFARWEKGKKVFRYDLITDETMQEPPRLDHDEEQQLKMLRKHLEVFGLEHMTQVQKDELNHLEERATIHRQEVK